MDEREWQAIEGSVEHIVFRNSENGWTVLDLDLGEELLKVVGVFPSVCAGEYLKLRGEFVEHRQFGRQFRAEYCERFLPTDTAAILRYLSSGAVKGIGPATAVRIVQKFGGEALDILENNPERLAEIKGISRDKAKKMGESYAEQFGLREVMVVFSQYDLTPNEAIRCWKKFGNRAVDKIKNNPYTLCEAGVQISFERIDQICAAQGWPQDKAERLEAGILYVLRHNLGNGHTCIPQDKLLPTASGLLGVEQSLLEQTLERMICSAVVKEEEIDGRIFIFLPALYRTESHIASRLFELAAQPRPKLDIEDVLIKTEKQQRILYEEQQRKAISAAVQGGLLVLTGGPGTGKTTTLRAIISILEHMGEEVAVTAPTGRAAKRISELTGREAKTLHRLLEAQWDDQDQTQFARHEKNKLEADAILVDEVSMVDVHVFDSLLRAMKDGCRLIMVGDTDQLPAVGCGCVLQDLIECGHIPVVKLTQVFRQAEQSQIITNAHRIVSGEMPDLTGKDGDFFFLPRYTAEQVIDTVVDLCARRLPNTYDMTVFDGIQLLCPGRKGMLGVRELNARLQAVLNPPAPDLSEMELEGIVFRTGDKVMHNKNNYDISWSRDDGEVGSGVFNGDIGRLMEVDPRTETMSVRYDDRVAVYGREDARDLELAYAVTVHKSQGSEFDAVIMPLFYNQPQLCYRNLLYTGVTRAKKLLIIVGSAQTVEDMVNNNKKTLRYSGLSHFMDRAWEWKIQ